MISILSDSAVKHRYPQPLSHEGRNAPSRAERPQRKKMLANKLEVTFRDLKQGQDKTFLTSGKPGSVRVHPPKNTAGQPHSKPARNCYNRDSNERGDTAYLRFFRSFSSRQASTHQARP